MIRIGRTTAPNEWQALLTNIKAVAKDDSAAVSATGRRTVDQCSTVRQNDLSRENVMKQAAALEASQGSSLLPGSKSAWTLEFSGADQTHGWSIRGRTWTDWRSLATAFSQPKSSSSSVGNARRPGSTRRRARQGRSRQQTITPRRLREQGSERVGTEYQNETPRQTPRSALRRGSAQYPRHHGRTLNKKLCVRCGGESANGTRGSQISRVRSITPHGDIAIPSAPTTSDRPLAAGKREIEVGLHVIAYAPAALRQLHAKRRWIVGRQRARA